MSLQQTCKHRDRFVLNARGTLFCCVNCGWGLNFDPTTFPNCIALLDGPDPNREWKEPTKLTGSGI